MSFSPTSSGTATPNHAGAESPPVGYRFDPTDRELINNFLAPKNRGQDGHEHLIADVEVCKIEPWDLPVRSMIQSNDQVWYFYCRRERKFKKNNRYNRTTKEGYWKPDGKARRIKDKHTKKVIGSKRTLVFHHGRPKGKRTKWVMHEYECSPDSGLPYLGDFVLCKLKNKSDEKDTKHDAYHLTALDPEIGSQELAKMASISSRGIYEPSHLMCFGSYNENQDPRVIEDLGELVDANSVESSPTFDSNVGSHPPKSTTPNSHNQIYPRLPPSNISPMHFQNNGIVEVVLSQLSLQTLKTTFQTSNIQNFDSVGAIETSLHDYQKNDITEVSLSQQSSQTPKTFDSLLAINSSLCYYPNSDIPEVSSFDPEKLVNANPENYSKVFLDSFHCDTSDGSSISPSQNAILSDTVVNSIHDVADSLMISDFENQNLDNQDGISSAFVEAAWSPSMAVSYTDYGTQNQYENSDIQELDGLLASDLEFKYEESEENSEFSYESGALMDSMLEQYHMVNSPLWMPIHCDEGPSSLLFPLECDSTLRPSPLCL